MGTSGDTSSPTKEPSSLVRNNNLSHPETMKYQMIAASNKSFPLPFRADYRHDSLPPWWAWHSRVSSLVLSLLIGDHKGVFVTLSHLVQEDVSMISFCCLAHAAVSSMVPWIVFSSFVTKLKLHLNNYFCSEIKLHSPSVLTDTLTLRMFFAPCKIGINSWLDSLSVLINFQVVWVLGRLIDGFSNDHILCFMDLL